MRGLICLSAVVVSVAAAAAGAQPDDMVAVLTREIQRVERDLRNVTTAEERAGAEARLRRAAAAVQKKRLWLALYELSTAWRLQAAYAFTADRSPHVRSIEDFKREWTGVGEPKRPPYARALPLLVAAVATASEAAAPATFRASLPYAEDVGLKGGLFYLGDAKAAADFGAFCRSLPLPPAHLRPTLRSPAREMDRFEADVVKLYDRADANGRRSFIPINVAMKIARERDAAGDHPAALLQYLIARYQLGLLATAAAAPDTSSRLEAFTKALTGADHSLAAMFAEMAAASLETPDPKGATAIVDFVLPEYMGIVQR